MSLRLHSLKDLIVSLGLQAVEFANYVLPMLGAFVAIGIFNGCRRIYHYNEPLS